MRKNFNKLTAGKPISSDDINDFILAVEQLTRAQGMDAVGPTLGNNARRSGNFYARLDGDKNPYGITQVVGRVDSGMEWDEVPGGIVRKNCAYEANEIENLDGKVVWVQTAIWSSGGTYAFQFNQKGDSCKGQICVTVTVCEQNYPLLDPVTITITNNKGKVVASFSPTDQGGVLKGCGKIGKSGTYTITATGPPGSGTATTTVEAECATITDVTLDLPGASLNIKAHAVFCSYISASFSNMHIVGPFGYDINTGVGPWVTGPGAPPSPDFTLCVPADGSYQLTPDNDIACIIPQSPRTVSVSGGFGTTDFALTNTSNNVVLGFGQGLISPDDPDTICPLDGVLVTVSSMDDPSGGFSGSTGGDGKVTVPVHAGCQYEAFASKDGFATVATGFFGACGDFGLGFAMPIAPCWYIPISPDPCELPQPCPDAADPLNPSCLPPLCP